MFTSEHSIVAWRYTVKRGQPTDSQSFLRTMTTASDSYPLLGGSLFASLFSDAALSQAIYLSKAPCSLQVLCPPFAHYPTVIDLYYAPTPAEKESDTALL